jgi:hypothetical protein
VNCPQCLLKQPDGRTDCVKCGLIFNVVEIYPDEGSQASINSIERGGLTSFVIGGGIAISVLSMPWLSSLFYPLITIIHELGHATTSWIFGYPSIPAFDFSYGGGVTINLQRRTALLALVYIIFVALLRYFQRNRLSLVLLSAGLALYTLFAFTRLHEAAILFMGHGFELIISGIFIYRALSGRSVINAAERPLYGFVGIFIVLYDIRFSYRLMTSANYRSDYGEAKGGGDWMDFSRLANEYMDGRLVLISMLFFICCFLPPVLSFLAHRYQTRLCKIFATDG